LAVNFVFLYARRDASRARTRIPMYAIIRIAKDAGFAPRFGLVGIDYKNNLKRIPRPSSQIYAGICKNNGLNI